MRVYTGVKSIRVEKPENSTSPWPDGGPMRRLGAHVPYTEKWGEKKNNNRNRNRDTARSKKKLTETIKKKKREER